jgi:hypothetical protein
MPHAAGFARATPPRKSYYRVVFQRDGRVIQTLYWNGSFEATRSLARQIAIKVEADAWRIFDSTDAEVPSEKHPLQDQGSDC